MKFQIRLFSLLSLVLAACGQNIKPEPIAAKHLGMVEIAFSGNGTQVINATAHPINSLGLRTINDITTGIELKLLSRGSFDVGTRGVDGVRYLSATFKVRNAAFCTPVVTCSGTAYNSSRQNLSFIAVSTASTINRSAVSNLQLFDGSPAPSLAQSILPTHGMDFDGTGAVIKTGFEDFQAFTEAEASSLFFPNFSLFPYGFVARCVNNCTAGTRDLPANPAVNQFDGRVTFAVKFPLQSNASADPYKFSLMFEIVDDTTTRVTQSLEEQNNPSLVATRAATLSAEVFTLPGVVSPSTCSVRTAGTAANPLAFLAASPMLNLPNLANQMFVTSGTAIGSHFTQPINAANSSNFVVNGFMTGKKTGAYTAAGNDQAFAFSPANSNPAGEELEVTYTTGISSLAGAYLCAGSTFRYRADVTPNSSGTFGTATSTALAASSDPSVVTTGDVNNDGNLDLMSANINTNTVSVSLGNGTGSYSVVSNLAVGQNPDSIVTGDINNDGKLDVVTGNLGASDVSILIGNGSGGFQTFYNYAISSPSKAVTLGDINSDGKLDLLAANYTANTVSVLMGNGDGSFQSPTTAITDLNPKSIAVEDANNDGKLDLMVANEGADKVSVLLGNGDGTFQIRSDYATGTFPESLVVADVNNDQKLDMLIANYISGDVSVLLGNGNGTFQPAISNAAGLFLNALAVGDVNGDSKLDLVTAHPGATLLQGGTKVLLGNGDGTFQTSTNYPLLGQEAITLGDLNNDGQLDIVATGFSSNALSVLLQQ